MDAIEPSLLQAAEAQVEAVAGVRSLERIRMRWMGNRVHAEVHIGVDGDLTTTESHQVTEQVRHQLFHTIACLAEVVVHVEPWSTTGDDHHQATAHHERLPQRLTHNDSPTTTDP